MAPPLFTALSDDAISEPRTTAKSAAMGRAMASEKPRVRFLMLKLPAY
jgi:hypothetical protein